MALAKDFDFSTIVGDIIDDCHTFPKVISSDTYGHVWQSSMISPTIVEKSKSLANAITIRFIKQTIIFII
jgi:hypothetical protein